MGGLMKDIKGYEKLYAVTEDGQVYSYSSQKFISQHNFRNGYLYVDLYKNGKKKKFRVHRLVADAYVPNPSNLPQVNHINENKSDNVVSNLEWVSCKENINYGDANTRRSKTMSVPIYCKELHRIFPSATVASQELGISRTNISLCLNKRRNTCGGYHWSYCKERIA